MVLQKLGLVLFFHFQKLRTDEETSVQIYGNLDVG